MSDMHGAYREYYTNHTAMKTLGHHYEEVTRIGYEHAKSRPRWMNYDGNSNDIPNQSDVAVKMEPHEKLAHCELSQGEEFTYRSTSTLIEN